MPVEALCVIKNNLLNIGLLQDTAHCCVALARGGTGLALLLLST